MTERAERILPGTLAMTPWMWGALWADLSLPGAPPDVAHTLVDEVVDQLAPHEVASATTRAALRRLRLLAAEHFLNDKGGRPDLKDGQLAPAFVDGQPFDLPLFPITGPGRRRFAHPPLLPRVVRDLFCPDDDTVLLPVHPQELAQRAGFGSPSAVLAGVRATAAGRTLRTTVDGCALQIKCDFAHVMLDRRYRPFSPKDARYGITTTQHLAPSGLGFFPEVLGVGDADRDMGAIVRLDQPHPTGPAGAYALPAYSLFASPRGFHTDAMLVLQLLQGTDAPVEVFLETIAAPLIDAVMSLQLQWGCSAMAHGQNLHLEFLPSGRPSGRGLISDLQNVWEHPTLCPRLGLSLPDDADYRAEHRAAKDADIAGTFQDYFLWKVMQPLLLCVERRVGRDTDLRPRTNGLIAGHVQRHADLVEAAPELSWFRDTYLR